MNWDWKAKRAVWVAISLGGILAVFTPLVGCGSGGGGAGGGAGAGQNLVFGDLTTRASGTQPTLNATVGDVTVTGIAGGDVTSLVFQESSPSLSKTQILFATNAGGSNLVSISPEGGREAVLPATSTATNPDWSRDGSKLAFEKVDGTGHFHIFTMNADGSGLIQVTSGASNDVEPSWSRTGQQLVFSRRLEGGTDNHLAIVNADGSNVHEITSGPHDDLFPSFSPNSDQIVFQRTRTTTPNQIFTVNSDGRQLAPLIASNFNDAAPAFSPDGQKIAFSRLDNQTRRHIAVFNLATNQTQQLTDAAPAQDIFPAWSPDGTKIAFVRAVDPNEVHLTTMNADGTQQARLSGTQALLERPAWQPFVQRRVLLGTDGLLGDSSAGVLFARQGAIVRTVVAFESGPGGRSTARVVEEPSPIAGGHSFTFRVTADQLASLVVGQIPDWRKTIRIGAGGATATANGALITFDPTDGSLATIVPFTENRSIGTSPSATRSSGTVTYRGSFVGVWDGTGKNYAPNGAREVHLDPRTGHVISVQ